MIPCYTVFNKETEMFTNIWILYDFKLEKFYDNYKKDIAEYSKVNYIKKLVYQKIIFLFL